MLRSVLLSTAALALVATAANANPKVTVSQDHRFVSVMPGKTVANAPDFLKGAKYSTIASKYPNGLYFCCNGDTISGPSSFFGLAYGIAEQFPLSKSGTLKSISAAVGYISGDDSVTLTLYSDNNNEPGTALASGTGTTTTAFGSCCGIVKVDIGSVNVSPGNYWVGITTTGANFESANVETVDEVNPGYVAGTSNGGQSWGASYQTTARPAVAVK